MLENSARVLRNRAWISAWKKGNGAKEERERENERNTRQFPMENRRKAMKERERGKEGGEEKREWRKTSAKERRRGSNERESLVRRDGR